MKDSCTGQGKVAKRAIKLPVLSGAQDAAIRKSSVSRWRALTLVLLNLFMVVHFIQWWFTGSTVSPIEPSETMYTIQEGAVNAGFIFFSLALIATLIFGRFVCGWGCHILALQDLCAWLLKKVGLTPRPFRSRLLILAPLAAGLYMFVWPTLYRMTATADANPLPTSFSNHLITTSFWATFPSVAVAVPFLFICGFLTVYFLGSKGFCTYACPYGGFFGVLDKVAPGRIRVTDACNECGHCTAKCTSNVLVHAEVKQYGMVVDPGCMKCMDCISVCPNDALYFGFGKPAVAVKKAPKKTYSFTWSQEIIGALVFIGTVLAVRSVYRLVPFLMSLGCAAITTFLVLRVWKLLRTRETSFYRSRLRVQGKLTTAGWIFISFAVIWCGLILHSGWIRYHEFEGERALQYIDVPEELALARLDPDQWLTPVARESRERGRSHLENATRFGLFTNSDALPKLAWLEYLSNHADSAVQVLERAANYQQGEARALSLYYRGTMLNRLGRYAEAQASLDAALAERSDLILAREEKGESLWQTGRKSEAVVTWEEALARNSGLVLVHYQLAGAAASLGITEDAVAHEQAADNLAPDDPLYQWMLGMRLQNLGMTLLAQKRFQRAIQLDPSFAQRLK